MKKKKHAAKPSDRSYELHCVFCFCFLVLYFVQGEGTAGGEASRGETVAVYFLLQRRDVQVDNGDPRRKHDVPRAASEACETPPRRVVLRHEEGESRKFTLRSQL